MSRWIDRVGAVVMAWYPGEQGGNGVADVLFGTVNPSGRLPITFPIEEGQLPSRLQPQADRSRRRLRRSHRSAALSVRVRAQLHDVRIRLAAHQPDTIGPTDSAMVSFVVRNTGTRAGTRGRAAVHPRRARLRRPTGPGAQRASIASSSAPAKAVACASQSMPRGTSPSGTRLGDVLSKTVQSVSWSAARRGTSGCGDSSKFAEPR